MWWIGSVIEPMIDANWKSLILAIRNDFARVAKAKSEVLKSLEKYLVFQNKYVILASLCADLHASVSDAPPYEDISISSAYDKDTETFVAASKRAFHN